MPPDVALQGVPHVPKHERVRETLAVGDEQDTEQLDQGDHAVQLNGMP